MKNFYCFIFIISFLTGCSSTRAVYNNYQKLVNIKDGVDAQEAKIIAQKKLINTPEKDIYRVTMPDIKTGEMVKKYPGYWFVIFGHNWFEPMSSNPLAGTYTELMQTEFLVVIDKKSGQIPFFGQWYPKRENDFDWVFDPHAYNRHDPLKLPPGKKSKELFTYEK